MPGSCTPLCSWRSGIWRGPAGGEASSPGSQPGCRPRPERSPGASSTCWASCARCSVRAAFLPCAPACAACVKQLLCGTRDGVWGACLVTAAKGADHWPFVAARSHKCRFGMLLRRHCQLPSDTPPAANPQLEATVSPAEPASGGAPSGGAATAAADHTVPLFTQLACHGQCSAAANARECCQQTAGAGVEHCEARAGSGAAEEAAQQPSGCAHPGDRSEEQSAVRRAGPESAELHPRKRRVFDPGQGSAGAPPSKRACIEQPAGPGQCI